MVKDLINDLNENKFFVGCMMIFVTIGGRFVISELNDSQKEMIHNPIIRRLFISLNLREILLESLKNINLD